MGKRYIADKTGLKNKKTEPTILSNYKIKAKTVKLISENGQFIGIVSLSEALAYSQRYDIDLVQLDNNEVPTCKCMELSKYVYEQKKKEHARNKLLRENTSDVKQINVHIQTDTGDLNRKLGEIKKFLDDGDQVKFSVQLRGREMAMQGEAFKLIKSCIEKLKDVATYDNEPKLNGKSIDVLFRKKYK
jgi:translation initiation factor IF-3